VFTTETSGTFYVAASKGKTPTGKIVSCYSNLHNSLSQVGIIAHFEASLDKKMIKLLNVIKLFCNFYRFSMP
jgi:hypothetical protein